MSDVNANIGVHIDTSSALTELKNLQRQLATFHSSIAKTSAAATAAQKGLQTNLLNSINSTGKFTATMGNVRSSTESFTHALESNKLSMREYFRYAGGASKTFGKLFRQEFDTIGKVAEDRVKKMQTQYIKMGRDANGAIKAMAITPTTLNMNDYATKTALAAQKQALFNQVVKQGSTSLLNFGKNTQWAGRQLMVGFTIPLAYFGTAAAKTFMDLEAQAIKFKRVYGDMFTTSEQTNKALEDVRKLAEEFTKYGVAVSKTMEMAASAAAMGKTGSELTAQVSEATRLAVLGGVEQQQALETTISLTNAFGIAAEDLAGKINFLNSVENQTVVSIEDLTIAVPKAGPVIQQLGGDVEDLAFFLTAMKEGGINASEGANALKSGLASLINPSKKASAFLADFGINIKGIVESNQGDIKGTVIAFSQALDTLDPLNRARAIEQLFGKFQFSRLSTLFQNVTKDGTQASKVLQLAGASVEELAILSERELKTVEDAVGTQFKSAVQELKLAIAPIGKTFLETITPVVRVIGDLLEKFNGLSDGTKKFIVVATTIVGGIGPVLLMTFGLLANGVANIVKLFLALRTGFLRLGGNSKILAEQTNYLNAEQLESATVAASLNQAHTRLTQSFTAETTAVKLLRQAYVDATIAAANFARANPGMMMPGKGRGKAPKKFATGATYVPGTGNKDTVPSVLTPGEAVIPKDVAQDPRFQPIIDAMVNGDLQAFSEGAVNVGSKSFKTKSQKTARDLQNTIAQLRSEGIPEEKIVRALEKNVERGRPMNSTQLKRRLSIGRGSASGTSAPSSIRNLAKQSQSGFLQETEAVKKALKDQGVVLTQAQEKNLFNVQASHIEETRNAGVKEWKANNLVADLGYVNNYINTVKGKLGTDLLKMSDAKLQELGIDRKELQKLQAGSHPTSASAAQTLRAVAQYDSIRNPSSYQAKAVVAGLEHRSKTNFYAQPMKTLAETKPISSRVENSLRSRADLLEQEKNARVGNDSEKLMKQIDKDIRKNVLGRQAPTDFGTQISPTTGHSFPVKGLGGIYQKPDGTKVFVKPVIDARAALAEQRATAIARDAHGLDSPKQEIKTMLDPTDPTGKRKLIVLESAFDSKFDPNKMTNKFTKDQYFKQLVAANLRGDKDLGRGNLSGNVLADVGTAGVFEKASGKRDFAKTMPSMAEQAKINLLGVKGGAKKFFAESTLGIPKGMTADQYHNSMIKEIDKVLPKLKETISKFDLDPIEKQAYSGMITRLEEGKKVNWREFHKIHSSVLATKKEALQDKTTGKITKIKGKPKPANVVSSTGKSSDKVITQVPPGKRIVQKPRGFISSRFGSRVMLPGYIDAPEAYDPRKGPKPKLRGGSATDILWQESDARVAEIQAKREAKAAERKAKAEAQSAKDTAAADKADAARKRKTPGIKLSDAEQQFKAEQRSLEKQIQKTQREKLKAEKDATNATNKGTKATEDTTKQTRLAGTKLTTAVNVFSGVTVAASFLPGKFGEVAQALTPFVIGLSTLTMLWPVLKSGFTRLIPLLSNPWVAAAAALIAVGVVLKTLTDKSKEAGEAQSKYIDQISATTEKMKAVGIITDQVGASEEMALRREGGTSNEYLTQFDRAGQQFGTNFLESDVGKSILKTFRLNLSDGGSDAMRDLALELSTYVSDGLMTAEDANSVARSIGINMSDMTITANLQGRLREILGPDGKDISTNPIEVRLKIAKESQKSAQDFATENINYLKEANKVSAKNIAVAISAGGILSYRKLSKVFSESGKLAGGAAASGVQSLEITQAQRDAQSKLYDDQVRTLKEQLIATADKEKQLGIETKIANLKTLQAYDDRRLAEQSKETLATQIKIFKSLSKAGDIGFGFNPNQTAYISALDQQIKDKYKDDPLAEVFLGNAAGTESKTLEVTIKTIVGSGNLSPLAGTRLLEMFGKEREAELETLLTTTLALKDPGKVQELINIATSVGGEIGVNLVTDISAAGQESKFDDRLAALTLLQTLDGKEINLGLFLKTDAIKKLDELVPLFNKVEKIKTPITKTIVQEFATANPDVTLTGLIDDWERYSRLPAELQKTVIQTFIAIRKTITPDNIEEMAKQEVISQGLGYLPGVSEALLKEYADAEKLAAQLNRNLYPDGVTPPKKGKGTGDGEEDKKGSRDTTLDDLLKKLKLTRDASINAEGGLIELRKVFNKANGDITKFAGLNELLREQGADEGFIDFLGGMDNAIRKQYVDVDKLRNGILKLSGDGIKAMALYKEAQLGAFGDTTANAIYQLQQQRTGFVALKSAGASSADALEMISDANFALSLSAVTSSKEVQELINKFKALRKETSITLAQTDPQKYFDNQMDTANRRYDLDETLARRKYEPQIEALELTIDATNRLIDAEQNRIKLDYDQPIESKQKEISVLQNQLSMGVEKQLDANSKISAALSEDQAVIGNIVDQINDKYDLQEKALEKISSINQEIIEQQKDQIGLADALTKGDISAAALAAEEMKQKSAAAVASKAQEMLDQRREADIAAVVGPSGLTAAQISKKQYDIDRSNYSLQVQREAVETRISTIEESIYDLQVLRGDALEGIARDEQKIYDLNVNQIQPLRDKLKAELDTIDAQRDKWRDAKTAIEKANLDAKDFKDQVIKAEGLVASLAKLWGDISDKEVYLTIKKIEEIIGNQEPGAGAGAGAGSGAGAATGPYDPRSGNTPDYEAPTNKAPSNFEYGSGNPLFGVGTGMSAVAAAAKAERIAEKDNTPSASKLTPEQIAKQVALELDYAFTANQAYDVLKDFKGTDYGDLAIKYREDRKAEATAGRAEIQAIKSGAEPSTPLTSAQIIAARKEKFGFLSMGGLVPKYFVSGGFAKGTDTIPAMLTPGEFVINKNAASGIGINNLNRLNSGESFGTSVYNYSVGINVTNADANANDIARAVMGQIKYIDSQRIRGQK